MATFYEYFLLLKTFSALEWTTSTNDFSAYIKAYIKPQGRHQDLENFWPLNMSERVLCISDDVYFII